MKRSHQLRGETHKWNFSLHFFMAFALYWFPTHVIYTQAANTSSSNSSLSDAVSVSGAESGDGAASTSPTSSSSNKNNGEDGTKITGNDIDPKAKMLMSNIALFAATMAAPVLVKQCPKAPSVWIYAGSAALYLANEIGLFTKFKNASDAEMAAYLGRGDEDKQINSLESAADQTENAQKAAKTRALVAGIAAAGFSAATAMALVENYTSWVKVGNCGPPTAGATSAIDLPLLLDEAYVDVNPKLLTKDSDNFDFMISYEEQLDFIQGKKSSLNIDEYYERKAWSAAALNSMTGLKEAFLLATEFTFSALASPTLADEGGTNWSGSGVKAIVGMLGAGAGVIALNSKAIASSKMVKKPLTRAALFGGMSVFAIGAAFEASNAAKRLGERSDEYKKLANSLRSQVAQSSSTTNQKGLNQVVSGVTSSADKNSNSKDDSQICYTGSGTTSISVDESCTCVQKRTCKSTNLPDLSKLPDFAGQTLLTDELKALKTSADSIYSGDLKGANSASTKLGKNAARITKLRESLVGKINKDNIAAGGLGNYDLDKLEDKFQEQLLKKVNDSFNGLSPSQQSSLAGFAPALDPSDKGNKEEIDSAAPKGKIGAIAATSRGNKSNQGSSWDFNFDDDKNNGSDPEAAALAEVMANENDQYEIDGDINDDRNKDIFKIITGRYLKSAYPVIFEER